MSRGWGVKGYLPLSFAMMLAPLTLGQAATSTGGFNAQITINDSCNIVATVNLNFGSHGLLNANVDNATAILVTCTTGTTFDIGLNEGTTAGGTTTTRKMTNGSDTIDYQMSQDGAHSTNWGNNVGTDTLASTGTGSIQVFPIFARVPAQTTPAAGVYSDTVTATVTF